MSMKRDRLLVLIKLLRSSPLSNREINEKLSHIKGLEAIMCEFDQAGMVKRTTDGLWYIPQDVREDLEKKM